MSQFSDVKYFKVNGHPSILGRGSFMYNDAFRIQFTHMNSSKGPFVSLPSEKDRNGKKDEKTGRDVYYPLVSCSDPDVREEMNRVVNAKAEEVGAGSAGNQQSSSGSSAVADDLPF